MRTPPLPAIPLIVLLLASPAAAQRGIDIDRLTPAFDGDGFAGIQATNTPGPGRWNVGLFTTYTTDPLVLTAADDEDDMLDVIDHRLVGDFQMQVGLGGRFAFGLDVPLLLYQDAEGDRLGDGLGEIAATGLGDPRFALRWRFLGEDARVYRERNEGPGVALQGAFTLPIGDENALVSERGATTDLQLIGDFHVLGAGVGGLLGWKHRFEPRDLVDVRFRDEIEAGGALKLPVPVTRDFYGVLEVRAVTGAGSPFDGPTTAVEGDFALRLRRGDLTVTAGVGRGLTDGVGSPAFRALAAVHWAPRVRDSDDDGIPDDRDECPFLPEDFDGFEDSNGCLDPDNDNDLIPDADDRCPNEPAEEFRDEDEDGCTDPLRDTDRDEIPDHEDDCPGRPEDRDEFEDEDGCPDPDNDGDGVLDEQDRCPGAAEDVDGFEDADGCPDPDDDRDGVLDAADQCPEEPETINGVRDDDGCPDRGGRALWQAEGDPSEADYTLRGNVRFAGDHTIPQGAMRAVDQLAMHLVARWPDRFRIAIGPGEEARREALKAALAERGVPAARIEIATDPGLRGPRVVVTRVPVEEEGTQQSAEPSAEPEEAEGGADGGESE